MPYLTTTRGSYRLDGWITMMNEVVARVGDVESIVLRPLEQFVPSQQQVESSSISSWTCAGTGLLQHVCTNKPH
jgi:hypothetical protein